MDDAASLLYRGQSLYTLYDDEVLSDLNIGQILNTVLEGLEAYDLDELYRRRPVQPSDIAFRQAIARELEEPGMHGDIEDFLREFAKAKRFFQTSQDNAADPETSGKWRLDAALAYCEAVDVLEKRLAERPPASEGLARFSRWLGAYARSETYEELRKEAKDLGKGFASFRYALALDIGHNEIHVAEDGGADDFFADLFLAFDRFELGALNKEIAVFADIRMNSLEKRLLEALRPRMKDLLARLCEFCARYPAFIHEAFFTFERETRLYLSYLAYADGLRGKGFPFAFPQLHQADTLILSGYDASLALVRGSCEDMVFNDFFAAAHERAFLLTGPNQGGKTTFSRMLGQIHFFAALGLPVPCRSARVEAFSGLATHFAAEEDPAGNSGRLQEELLRLARILCGVPRGSVVILNELFSSTTTLDACEMGQRVMRMFREKECLCLYVTHISELARLKGAVALVAESIDGDPPALTYKIVRGLPGGPVYARQMLNKYRLRGADIEERIHASFAALS